MKLFNRVSKPFTNTVEREATSIADLRCSLLLALDNTTTSSTYTVLDAVDEGDNAKSFARSLVDITQSPRNAVELILIDREDLEVYDSLDMLLSEFLILPNDIRGIIWMYIGHRVEQNKKISGTELGNHVHTDVVTAADGLWLYARL